MNSHSSVETLDFLVQLKRINPKFIPKSVIKGINVGWAEENQKKQEEFGLIADRKIMKR